MDREEFIKICCAACAGGSLLTVLESCAGSKMINGSIEGSDLVVPLSEFVIEKTNPAQFRNYLIIQNERLQYPVCLYRFDAEHYSALWLRCSHQGTELQVFGDRLHCPGHGSEFNNLGIVVNGPASEPLRTFQVRVQDDLIKISMS